METVISQSANQNEKYDALVDGKKYPSALWAIAILVYTKMKRVKNDI